jgi:hypothetical protein
MDIIFNYIIALYFWAVLSARRQISVDVATVVEAGLGF